MAGASTQEVNYRAVSASTRGQKGKSMDIRVGSYEIQPIDKWNWAISRVAEDGEKGKKTALDGKRLVPMNKSGSTIPAALEVVRQLALKSEDRAVLADVDGALAKIEELNAEFRVVAKRIEKAATAHEAA